MFALVHTRESTKQVTKYLLMAFSYMRIPETIKTDNVPAFTSDPLKSSALFGESHITLASAIIHKDKPPR